MEKRVWTLIGGLLDFFFIAILSCNKSTPPKPMPITPLQTLVNSDSTLTLFHRMLLQANDAALLADDTVTLLIPRNDVLRQAGYSETLIDSTSAFLLDRMLRYGYVLSPSLAPDSGVYTPYPTLLGATLYIQKDAAGLLLLNGNTKAANIAMPVGKASVYYLNEILPAAADSLPALLQSDSTLTFLAEAFLRTNVYDSLMLSGNFTLLAPVNAAFQQAGYDSIGAIDSADINTLIQLVQSQVIKGTYFTNTFPASGPVSDLLGHPVVIGQAGGGLQFSGGGNPVPVNWLSGNQVAGTNTVVHRTDGLLSP